MNKFTSFLLLITLTSSMSCSSGTKESNQAQNSEALSFTIENLDDKEYPDNPNIGYRSSNFKTDFFRQGMIEKKSNSFEFDFTFLSNNNDSIVLKNVNISEFIPTIPEHIKSSNYLSYISCINQEWNRNQVTFKKDEFNSNIVHLERIDLARNCLNAYLWEIIVYTKENTDVLPYAHGWFDFPGQPYAKLFEQKNNVPFSQYKDPLENWVDPPNKLVDLNLLRTVQDTLSINYRDLSDQMYPLKGARKKKYKEIIHPDTFTTMRNLQSDSTLFATFSPPGIYNKKDPRTTELGRFYNLTHVDLHTVEVPATSDTLYEIELSFTHKTNKAGTKLIVGGIDLNDFPVLTEEQANDGWKNSMGIGNHSFYESYDSHLNYKTKNSSYYALLTDEEGNWLDSHKIGIDGPIFHFSDEEKKHLHLWLLSFERHALVGHYLISIP